MTTAQPAQSTSNHLLHINGDWVASFSGETFTSTNPANGEVVATLARGREDDIDHAVATARAALEGPWSRVGPADRQRMLLNLAGLVDKNADELAMLDSIEMGAPLARTRRMVDASVGFLEWYASLARHIRGETIENLRPTEMLSYTLREPVGVVGAITPWNTPIPITTWKLGPVLATGCTLVHKPAADASLSALLLADLSRQAGIPAGVVNVVTGLGDAGASLAAHDDVDKIAFTGSVATGQRIIKASAGNVKRLTLELGGKSPNVVFADADLDAAAEAAARGIFGNSGQVCVAPSRLFVERSIYEEFTRHVVEVGRSLVVGDPLDATTDLGPVASDAQLHRVTDYIESGTNQGARLVTGGQRLIDGDLARGYYLEPTIFTDVADEMDIAREEIFGPVLAASSFESMDEVAARCNGTRYGLASYVWTRDLAKAHHMASAIRAGVVSVNSYGNLDPAVPVGGYKMSGYGRELGVHQLDDYLQTKSVWVRTSL